MMKYKMRKIIAIICLVAVFLSSFPTWVFAQEAGIQTELKEAIEGGEEMKELFPNGVFNFAGTRFSISEDKGTYEIQIARQGGTQGEVTVDFKAIDVSAKYGSDYVIEVPGLLWNKEIPVNPDSKPLLEDAVKDEIEIVNSDDLGMTVELPTSEQKDELEKALEESSDEEPSSVEEEQETQPEQIEEELQQESQSEEIAEGQDQQETQPAQAVEEQLESQPEQTVEGQEQQEAQPEQTVEQPQGSQPEQSVEETQEPNPSLIVTAADQEKSLVATAAAQEMVTRVSGLKSASNILTGKTYNNPDWKELDLRPSEAEALNESYQEYFDRTPGMETTLTFKDGEYLKSIYIKTIDDNLSESEEQFIIVLSNATGGAEVGALYTGWVNIIDNEPFEESVFEMELDRVYVEAGIPQATVKVKRTKGIHTMTYVTVGTAGSTAEPNIDYVPVSKRLLFLPEVTEQTLTVNLITTYTDEDKFFGIIIDDSRVNPGKEKTIVTLKKATGSYPLYASKANGDMLLKSMSLMLDYSVNSQSSALEKITPNGRMEAEGKYAVMPDDFSIRYGNNASKPTNTGTYGITINPYNANSSSGVQAPVSLAGVKSLEFSWSNTGAGKSWYEHNDWWLFGWHCRSSCGWRNTKEFDSKFVINGPAAAPWTQWSYNQYMVKQFHGAFAQRTDSLQVKPWMWSSSNIEYWAWNGKDNTDNKLNANAVRLYLQPYNLMIENDPNDTGVMARTVTGINDSGEPVGTGSPVNVGTMRIRSVSRDGNHNTGISSPTQKVVYRSDVITFEPVFNTDPSTQKSYADDAYFWGYKVRDRQGNWKYFEGNVLNLNSQWFRENAAVYQNETQGLYANALLRNNGENWSIEVRPVFKAKNETFIKLDIDASKGNIDGFLQNAGSRVFAISKFDTLKLKVLTKDNATVHNWYVIDDNSNIKVNSLTDATTYFNNVNVGSSGNLPTTSSFMANANKVELNDSNINPSVKTELTYKPAARFTYIMPSFAVNAITVQENPANRTKYEAYDIKIISEGRDIRPDFLDDDTQEFYRSEQASKKTYTFEYKLRPTGSETVPATILINLYRDTFDVKAQLVETKVLTRDASGVYRFELNYWDDKYFGCYATMVINDVEQPVDFMLQSGAFVTLNDDRNNAITAGDAFNPIVYDRVTRNDVYTINGYTQSNFSIEWMNATGDLDKDGIISPLEDSLFKDYRAIDRTKTVGDTYYLKASYDMPTVYYNFVLTDPNRDTRVISGNISLADKTYFNQNAVTTIPLSDIEITVGGLQAITDSKGNFSLESNKFEAGKSYSCMYLYQGYKYTGVMMVGQNNIIIDMFKDPDIELTSLKLYEIPQNGGDELKPANGYINLYDESDRSYDLEFDLSSGRLVGTSVQDAILVVRDKDGLIRDESYRLSKQTGTPGRFVTRINPNSIPANMNVGDRIYIRPIDDKGMSYPEIAAGIRVVQNPEKIKIQFSVDDNGSIPTVPLFGSMMGKLDFLDTTADKAKPMTDQDRARIESLTGGASKALKSAAATASEDSEDFEDWKIDETEMHLLTISIGFDNDMHEGWSKAVQDSKSKVNKSGPDVAFSVGVVLVYQVGDDGKVYFNQLAIGGEVGVGMGITFNYITPIGVPVYLSLSFSAGIGASVSLVPKDGDNPPLMDATTSWKGMVTGEFDITITVGVGVELGVGVSVLKLYLAGSAEAVFPFTTVDFGIAATASFSATLGLRIFVFTKEWTIISKTWGATTVRSMMAAKSQLYEPLSGFDQLSRDYIKNRSQWMNNDNSRMFRAFMASGGSFGSVSEHTVLGGAYPYPSNKLVNLPNGEFLWVYLDDVPGRAAQNRTAVFYSIVSADGKVSDPVLIDDDGTLDEAPDVLDLGNGEILITWSDASRPFTQSDKEIDVLTHMDISAAFFDVRRKTMSEPTNITHTSGRVEVTSGDSFMLGDYCGDTSPRAAYDPETGKILLYYIKSDYYENIGIDGKIPSGSMDPETGSQVSGDEAQLVIGDIVNAYSLITYRYAEKVGTKWVWNDGNSYTPSEEAAISAMVNYQVEMGLLPPNYTFDTYKSDWYGQRFLDVSQLAKVTENRVSTGGYDTTDDEGNSYTVPVTTTVQQEVEWLANPIEPRVVDTAVISYNGLALFAYSTDEDWDLKTDDDQEIYLQIYNFSENSFSHPIRLTTDNVKINGVPSSEYYVKDSQPKFVRSNGITYLFWNRNGSIAYMDISGLVKYGLKKISNSSDYSIYVIDKGNDNYSMLEGESRSYMEGRQASTGKWGEIVFAVDKNINPNPSEDNVATADRAINGFDVVASDDGDVYLMWTEYQTVLIDKEDINRAADPENQIREKQVYVARWQPETMIERVELDYLDEHEDQVFTIDGSTTTYQYVYSRGVGFYPDKIKIDGVEQVLDYTKAPDVNGFIGGAKAGDPIILQRYVPTDKAGWSKPIQITSEAGANYDELGIAALEGNAGVKIAFIKYMQELEPTNNGKKIFKQNLDNRSLGLLTYRPAANVEFSDNSITFGNLKPKAGDKVPVYAEVKNTGIDAMRDVRVEFYQIVDGVETLVDTRFHGTYYMDLATEAQASKSSLVGGDAFVAELLFEMPSHNGDVSIKAVLKYEDSDGLEQTMEAQRSFVFEAVSEISDLRYEFIDIGKVVVDGTITNAGNKDDTLNIEISLADRYGFENTVAYLPVTLKQGESAYFSREIEIHDVFFSEVAPEAGQAAEGLKEAAIIKIGMGAVKDEITVVRSAPARAVEVMNEVTGFSVGNRSMAILRGTTGKIEPQISFKTDGVGGEKTALRDEMIVEYASSNPNVVQVASDGTVYALAEGTATVQAVLMPATTLSVATRGSSVDGKVAPMAQQLASSATLPSSMLRIENVVITVNSGNTGGGGSPSDGGSTGGTTPPPAAETPADGTQAEIKVPAKVDSNNNVTASVSDQMVTDAINKAKAEAEKNGQDKNDIVLVLSIETGSQTTGKITVTLPKAVQEAIIANNISSTIIVVNNPDIRINLNLETLRAISRQVDGDVNVTATQANNSQLSGAARTAVGNRPVYDIGMSSEGGSEIRNFGGGSVTVTIPYTLGINEKAENVCAVYIDENGNVTWLTESVYDSEEQVLRFRTNHFSLYGVGYSKAASAFNDIEGHWAKKDIEFVVSRGLFSGTSKTAFSPNIAMTRGMFVTVLGRLAKADVSGIEKSSFTDVKDDAYYMGYIEWARDNNIVSGTGNGKFSPDQPITREQMAAIMQNYVKSKGMTLPKVYTENTFADSDKISGYAKNAVNQMQMAGILSGKGGNRFDPQNTATRAEVAAVLRRFLELMLSK